MSQDLIRQLESYRPADFRGRCKLLRELPCVSSNLHESLVELLPAESKYRELVLNLQNYEQTLASSSTFEDRGLRVVLGDNTINPEEVPITTKAVSDMADKVSAHLATYKLLDLELLRCGRKPSFPVIPRPKSLNVQMLGVPKAPTLWTKLLNWKEIMLSFNSDVESMSTEVQGKVWHSDSHIRKSLYHLQGLADSALTVRFSKAMHNFRIAAFHYSLMKETASSSSTSLPGLPHRPGSTTLTISDLTTNNAVWEKYDSNTVEKMKSFLRNNKRSELMLPLHGSLLLSPLLLLLNINLSKAHFQRPLVYKLSCALGNEKPDILTRVENAIWQTLWEVNEDSEAGTIFDSFKKLVASEAFMDALALPSSDLAFNFFSPYSTPNTSASSSPNAVQGHNDDRPPPSSAALTLSQRVRYQAAPTFSQLDQEGSDVSGEEDEEGGEPEVTAVVHGSGHRRLAEDQYNDDMEQEKTGDSRIGECDPEEEGPEEEDQEEDEELGKFIPEEEEDQEEEGPGQDEVLGERIPEEGEESGEDEERDDEIKDVTMVSGEEEQNDADDDDDVIMDDDLIAEERPHRAAKARDVVYKIGALRHSKGKGRNAKSAEMVIEDDECADENKNWKEKDTELFVKFEECNLDISEKSKVKFGRNVTAWGPSGEKIEFEPMAHTRASLTFIEKLIAGTEDCYIDGKPLHVNNNSEKTDHQKESVFKVINNVEYASYSHAELQKLHKRQNIVITGRPKESKTFKEALEDASSLQRVTTIQDQSYSLDSKEMLRRGKVRDILTASQSNNPRILNALHLPDPWAEFRRTGYASDVNAMLTMYLDEMSAKTMDVLNKGDMRWFLAALATAIHRWHIDSDGFATFIEVITGAKWWFVLRPKDGLDSDAMNSISLLLDKKFDLSEVKATGLFDIEAILLQDGDMLLMRPGTLHAVITVRDTVCRGGHYYATSTMKDTFASLIHTFVCDLYITNISHPPSRFILTQMINFYHATLLREDMYQDDRARPHAFLLEDPAQVADVLVVCVLGTLINVLTFETYIAPGLRREAKMDVAQAQLWKDHDVNGVSEDLRKLFCLARGQSFEIVAWLDANFSTGLNNTPIQSLFSQFLLNICKTLCNYMYLADKARPVSHIQSLTLEKLQTQINAVLVLAARRDPSMLPAKIHELKSQNWKLPLNKEAGCSILPNWKGIEFKRKPSSVFKRATLSMLTKLGETELDQRFAKRLEIKREIIDEDIPVGNKRSRRI